MVLKVDITQINTAIAQRAVSTSDDLWPRTSRVVNSEISGKNPEISENLLITYVNKLFPSLALQSHAVK